jgi:signal transduction histidine kinase/CheY-like chemotaxis protein
MTIKDIRPPEDLPALAEELARHDSGAPVREWRHLRKDGKPLDVEISAIGFQRGKSRLKLVLANDVTPRKALEIELREAQKLEALGRLAGGVAHDFNNLIMIISSYAELMEQNPQDTARVRKNSEQILQASERAAMLTQQLLAFSRKQVLVSRVIDLNAVLKDMFGLVQRLLGENIELQFDPEPDLGPVKLDVGQITQVVLNLCANARDAIQGPGELRIITSNVVLEEDTRVGNSVVPAGSYSALTVEDSGSGMSADTQAHIFEPFFTTKARGKGTGLGLATVYGIVKQSAGYIDLSSDLGMGSKFTLYFPRAFEAAETTRPSDPKPIATGRESILVVEDEHQLRAAIVDSLRTLGYNVVHAMHGKHAIEVAESLPTLDLLLTDVVMPQMGGADLAEYMKAKYSGLKVIFMSGYADGMVQTEQLDANTIFLPKPVSLSTLARNVRELLAAAPKKKKIHHS